MNLALGAWVDSCANGHHGGKKKRTREGGTNKANASISNEQTNTHKLTNEHTKITMQGDIRVAVQLTASRPLLSGFRLVRSIGVSAATSLPGRRP